MNLDFIAGSIFGSIVTVILVVIKIRQAMK